MVLSAADGGPSLIRVAISGAGGRLAVAVAEAVEAADDLELTGAYNPNRGGSSFAGLEVVADPDEVEADVVVESTNPTVVMDNLRAWRRRGFGAVVGTSGFTEERLADLRRLWGDERPGCLVVPNFAVGAVLMARFAELAAPHFEQAEVIERHHADKPDAPSGTSLNTASRIAAAGGSSSTASSELVAGARGADVGGVKVHSIRLEGVLSYQEVALSNSGELFSVTHQSTSYASFAQGAVLSIRHVAGSEGVAVGLDHVLGI
ncbi:MAG TPA: 4-hydroxy-tetrahydrodipicolinate reductase [Acidimicrobiia bacterium]|jgi:4-hydroxy-tetrahydrodipicolinate reductase|nr:4-hydroxy-tetrahydrodipicolinate reductase [Acidimicrobiia bacterium]